MRPFVCGLLVAASFFPAAASAQSSLDGRVGRLESEMRAVQRKVFPGGASATLQPEIVPDATPVEASGAPATSAVADLSGRVTALEQQMASMTDQIERNGYQIRQLQQQFDAYRKATDTKLGSGADGPAPIAPAAVSPEDRAAYTRAADAAEDRPDTLPAAAPSRTRPPIARPTTRGETTAPAAVTPVPAVAKPSTGDPAEDGYLYGYRLWQAKQYPEAEAQLKKVVATYPKSRRANFAQNLLGRAYLDEGKPSLASMAFYENYKKYPDGERSPESLYYLAQALMQLKKPTDACKVYGELTDVYGAKISARMKADVAKGRTAAKCN